MIRAALFPWCATAALALAVPLPAAAGKAAVLAGSEAVAGLPPVLAGDGFEVVPTGGPAEMLRRLEHGRRSALAVLPSDLAQACLDAAARGNPDAAQLLAPARVVARVAPEQIHLLVRSDSEMNTLGDIRAARINAGPAGSGAALTTAVLYRLLFGTFPDDGQIVHLGAEDGLASLVTDRQVDVAVIVAEAPATLLAHMRPEARRYVKLLRFDPGAAAAPAVLAAYSPATIRAGDYPNLLDEDLPGLAVERYLVAYGQARDERQALATRVARALCAARSRPADASAPEGAAVPGARPGWHLEAAAARILAGCGGQAAPAPSPCPAADRDLGLCE